jgi:hypothetical protein
MRRKSRNPGPASIRPGSRVKATRPLHNIQRVANIELISPGPLDPFDKFAPCTSGLEAFAPLSCQTIPSGRAPNSHSPKNFQTFTSESPRCGLRGWREGGISRQTFPLAPLTHLLFLTMELVEMRAMTNCCSLLPSLDPPSGNPCPNNHSLRRPTMRDIIND